MARKGTGSGGDPRKIRDEFEAAFADKSATLDAAFSSNKCYTDIPNPAIKLADYGFVGVPLSTGDAEVIKRQAKKEMVQGELEAAGRWEVDTKSVTSENPKWQQFVSKAADEACTVLGVNVSKSKPRCELSKLVLFTPGSQTSSQADSTDRRNLFATILFVLPSHFTGGSISVSHEDFSAEYETVGNTILETQVVCWYTGVAYKIAPITTGHRLVLAYHIYNTAQNPCPTLPSTSSLSARLTKVLLAWKRDRTGQSPTKLLYLLDGAYPATSLKKTALEGADARTLAVLEILASHHGFGLGMAHVVVALTGTADDKGHRMEEDEFGGWRGSGCAYDDVSDEEAEDLEFLDVESWDVNVWPFVDLEGDKILESLEYKEDLSEMVPKLNPARDMWHEAHDDQEYTKDMYRAGRLERTYRRTALVIWPDRNELAVMYPGREGFDLACAELPEVADQISPESDPSWSERKEDLIAFILAKRSLDASQAAEALCDAACALDDLALWVRAIETCSPGVGVATLPEECVLKSLECFAFQDLVSSFELMLANDPHNLSRLNFLASFDGQPWEPVSDVYEDAEYDDLSGPAQQAHAWATSKLPSVLETLKKPTVAECAGLLEVAHKHGGLAFLKDSTLPQLFKVANAPFLLEFAQRVFAGAAFPPGADKSTVVTHALAAAIAKAALFKPRTGFSTYDAHAPMVDKSGEAAKYAKACVELGYPQVIKLVVKRVTDIGRLTPAGRRECARTLMMPLVGVLAGYMRGDAAAVLGPAVRALQEAALGLYLGWMADTVKAHWDRFTKDEAERLVNASVVNSDTEVFVTCVIPRLQAMQMPESVRICIVDALRAYGVQHGSLDALAPAFRHLVLSWADKILGSPPVTNANLTARLDGLSRWTCDCQNCKSGKAFISQKTARETQDLLWIGASARTHVEGFLNRYARGIVTWAAANTGQGLKLKKAAGLNALLAWRSEQQTLTKVLTAISPRVDEQKRLLAPDYDRIMLRLRGDVLSLQAAPPPPAPPPSGPASVTWMNVVAAAGASAVSASTAPSTSSLSPPTTTASTAPTTIQSPHGPDSAAPPSVPAACPSAHAMPVVNTAAAPATNPLVGSSSANKPEDSHGEGPPAKRRKMLPVAEDEIIDLT